MTVLPDQDAIVFLVLSPYDNEQADLVARVSQEPKIDEIPAFKKLLHKFITKEIMPWQGVEKEFGGELTQLAHFDKNSDGGKKRFEDFRGRVVEHNIRTMANYYTRISSKRLAALLELPEDQTEEFLSTLVVKQTVVAKINRPAGVVTFRQKQDAAAILEEWSASTSALMRQVDHAAHVIEKEQMALKVNN